MLRTVSAWSLDTTDSPFKGREDREMQSYMEQMDAELARTSIADSFEKVHII